jgi:hypothetical protein
VAAAAAWAGILAIAPAAHAGEGGISHLAPGTMATLADNVPTAPGSFVKPLYMHYSGDISAPIPTAIGLVGNVDARSNTLAVAAGHTFATTVLGGAHYTAVVAVPYTWVEISGDAATAGGASLRRVQNSVSGLGDVTIIPAMLAWKSGEWQFNALLPIYAPTGSYEKGRLGNTGLNYWTFDPTVGVAYGNAKGFNALLYGGLAMNTENDATHYRSGNLLHFDGSLQQLLPVGNGFVSLGVEGFYFKQVTCDSGAGATLGCFKGKTAGLGPVVGYIHPFSKTESLVVELKWLAEMDTQKRLEGDYLWLKAVYKF